MKTLVGRWQIESDPKATARCYEQTKAGWACDCAPCRNFITLDRNAFSPAALELFEQLGVDFKKPAEVYHNTRLENGRHDYGGWFHFVGTIESGADALRPTGNDPCQGTFDLEPLGKDFMFGFSHCLDLVPEPFCDQKLVQLEFNSELPWVLSEPQPS